MQAGAGAPVRYLAWNGGELAGEWNSNGGPIFYAYDNEGRPTFGANFTPNHYIYSTDYLTDERGSLVGESDGTLRAYAYDAYGRETKSHPSLLGYAGGVALPGAGLVHFRARAYDAATGRFVSADLIGIKGGINLYEYAGDDPITRTDPSGLEPRPERQQTEVEDRDKEHTKNARPSTEEKHQQGQTRIGKDAKGGEKGDDRRPHGQTKPKGTPSQPAKNSPGYLRPGPKGSPSPTKPSSGNEVPLADSGPKQPPKEPMQQHGDDLQDIINAIQAGMATEEELLENTPPP